MTPYCPDCQIDLELIGQEMGVDCYICTECMAVFIKDGDNWYRHEDILARLFSIAD